jgi:predicted RNA-binding Zn-ribbon protein involved in translation (DUF1610 family)
MANPASRVQERRIDRLSLPSCPSCKTTTMAPVSRTDYVVYFRCPECGHIESVRKPNGRLGG